MQQGTVQDKAHPKNKNADLKAGKKGYKLTKLGWIPEEWEVKMLKELCINFRSGIGITSKNIYKTGPYAVYGGNGLRGFTNKFTHEGNYLLIGRQGALCGNIVRISGKNYVSEHAIAVQTNENNDNNFLAYKLEFINLNRLSESSAQPGLSVDKLLKLKIPLPPLPEQKKIAEILSAWDKAIAKTERLIAQKQAHKKALMQQLLTGKWRFKEFVKSEKMKYTELGMIPEDWEIREIGKIVDFLDSKRRPLKSEDRDKIKGTYPYYGATGIIDYVNDYIFDEEIILLGEDGENILSRNSRLVYLVRGKVWVNNHTHVLRPKKNVNGYYLAELLESIDYKKYNTGTAQPKLNKEVTSKIHVKLPELREQQKIASVFSAADQEISTLQNELKKLKEQKKGLMQKLLTGEVRVKVSAQDSKD